MINLSPKFYKSVYFSIIMKVLLLKPAELVLKSKITRRRFESVLYKNIRKALRGFKIESLTQEQSRYILKCSSLKKAKTILKDVPGLSYVSIAEEIPLSNIKETALNLMSKKSFGVRAKSLNKSLPSRKIEVDVGKFIQDKTKASVNLTKPAVWIFIEVVGKKAYVSNEKSKGAAGLPVGVSGTVIAIISKKDDLIAAKMIEKRGSEVIEFKTKLPLKKAMAKAEILAQEHRAKAIVIGLKKLPADLPKSKVLVFMPLIGLDKKPF